MMQLRSAAAISPHVVARPSPVAIGSVGLLVMIGGVGLAAVAADVSAFRVLVLLLIAPLAEEALFRAGLQEAMLRRGQAAWSTTVVSALAFGLLHVLVRNDISALLVVVPALLIGAVYAHRRRLRHCVLLHAAFNASWLAWVLWGPTLLNP